MRPRYALAAIIAAVATGAYAGNVVATPSSGVSTTILGKSAFDELAVSAHIIPADIWQARLTTHERSDIYVVDNRFAAGATTGWHSHPGPSLILVVSGTVTNYTSDDPSCAGHS